MAKSGASRAAELTARLGAQTEPESKQPREQKKVKTGQSGRQMCTHAF